MNESIFEGNAFDENQNELIDNPEVDAKDFDDESESEKFIEFLTHMRNMMPDSEPDTDECDTDECDTDLANDKRRASDLARLRLFSHMREAMPDFDDDDDSDTDDCNMDAEDYHNKAVDRARHGKNSEAASICMSGLKKFPHNVDLLADIVKYSSETGDMTTAAEYYSLLKSAVPFQRWNWRAYSFSLDYLLKEDPIANENECRTIIENYKHFLPYEEKASMAESELEMTLGNTDESMRVLEKAIRTHTNASQCAMKLADMQMDRGLCEEVLVTTGYGIAASAAIQPSISTPHLYYIRVLAKDHLLHKKAYSGQEVTAEEVNDLQKEYNLLLTEFPELFRFLGEIKTRIALLKSIKTV